MAISQTQLIKFLKLYSELINKNKEELTEFDRLIGDADHGVNMDRGMQAVYEKLEDYDKKEIADILKDVGITLVSHVGGASGPLYGTAFMRAATIAQGKDELEDEDILEILDAMIEGIKQRGKAEENEKTMLDSIIPGRNAFEEAIKEGENTINALKAAKDAAWEGVNKTVNMMATKGRASYLGERSIGVQDPGATSAALLFEALLATINNEVESGPVDKVGIVIVSHSPKIAEGTKELALEMAPDANIAVAGGDIENGFGTDLNKIIEAIETVDSPLGVLVLIDMGSALMSAEMALETIGDENVEIVDAPLVEGAVFAAIESVLGSDRERIKEVLASTKEESKF